MAYYGEKNSVSSNLECEVYVCGALKASCELKMWSCMLSEADEFGVLTSLTTSK